MRSPRAGVSSGVPSLLTTGKGYPRECPHCVRFLRQPQNHGFQLEIVDTEFRIIEMLEELAMLDALDKNENSVASPQLSRSDSIRFHPILSNEECSLTKGVLLQ